MLTPARIRKLRQGRINRKLAAYRKTKLLRRRIYLAFSEYRNFFSAIRAFQITEILYDAKYRDVHHFCHIVGLLDDHLYQFLRGCDNHDTVDRQ